MSSWTCCRIYYFSGVILFSPEMQKSILSVGLTWKALPLWTRTVRGPEAAGPLRADVQMGQDC